MILLLRERPYAGGVRLLYTGNVKDYRGGFHHVRILHNMPDAEVFLVGRCDRALAEQLHQAAGTEKARLHLEGVGYYVAHERIIDHYLRERWTAALAVFLPGRHTLRKELTKIFEHGVWPPVICSDFPNLRRIVAENDCGLCVNPEDSRSMKPCAISVNIPRKRNAQATTAPRGTGPLSLGYPGREAAGTLRRSDLAIRASVC